MHDVFHRMRGTYESHVRRAHQTDYTEPTREELIEAVREAFIAAGQAELIAVFVFSQEDLCREVFTTPWLWKDASELDRAFAIGKLGDLIESFQVETLTDFLAVEV